MSDVARQRLFDVSFPPPTNASNYYFRDSRITALPILQPTMRSIVHALNLITLCLAIAWLNAVSCLAKEAEVPPSQQDQTLQRGKDLYLQSCAVCHGKAGEGVEEFHADPLRGDFSVTALAELISETMPEDDPETCVGQEAVDVATYIHQAFYSQAAQVRNRPPQIGLARLTGTQLRQSLADLYAYSGRVIWAAKDHGVKGVYYSSANRNEENRRIERTDDVIHFDFGNEGPGEGIDPKQFFIDWRGAIKADHTGDYEIVVRSTCSFVCYLGAYDRKFIDNHVQSGDKTEFRRVVKLTTGRVYPLRIDFFQRPRKTEQPPAKISLSWIPPGGVEQIIPATSLLNVTAPPTFSLQTKLPPDDRSYGYERGITVDRQWDDSTTAAALEFAQIAIEELWPRYLQRHRQAPEENRAKLRGFLAEIAETAMRGPLTDDNRKLYVDDQVDAAEDDGEAIKRSLLAILKSPRFLYPLLDQDRSVSQRAANRLALVLFDSLPSDQWLTRLARGNKLEKEEQIRATAKRMVYDFRTQGKVRELLYQWLNIGEFREINKEEETFPGFDQSLVSDLRASLDQFLDEVVWGDSGDYRQLFLADWTYTNERLEKFYGDTWAPAEPGENGLRRSVSAPQERVGVISHPYLMSRLAYHNTTSPIHRGVLLIRNILGRTLNPPQAAFAPLAPDLHPNLTTRERVELQTSPNNCQVCHIKINGLGFTLENFDAAGRYRDSELQRPINSAGAYTTRADERIEISGPRELAKFLATSNDSHRAFVSRTFQHFVKQPVAAYGPETLDQLTASFASNDFNIRDLLMDIAVIAATKTDLADKPSSNKEEE